MNPHRTRCPKCRGTGIDPTLRPRYTTGGHNDRRRPVCRGECYVEDDGERRELDGGEVVLAKCDARMTGFSEEGREQP